MQESRKNIPGRREPRTEALGSGVASRCQEEQGIPCGLSSVCWGPEVGGDGVRRSQSFGGPHKALAFPQSEMEATGEFRAEE